MSHVLTLDTCCDCIPAQAHGFASQVLFRQACAHIPKGAVCLEVGPHALLRTPLRQNRHGSSPIARKPQFCEPRLSVLRAALVLHLHCAACTACCTMLG